MKSIMKICKIFFLIIVMSYYGIGQNDHCVTEFSYLYKIDTVVLKNPEAELLIEKYKDFSIVISYKDSLLINMFTGLGNDLDTLYFVKDLRNDSVNIFDINNKLSTSYHDTIRDNNVTITKTKCDPISINNKTYYCRTIKTIDNKMLDSITAYVNVNKHKQYNIFLQQKELNEFNGDIYKYTLYNPLFNVTYIRNKLSEEKVFKKPNNLSKYREVDPSVFYKSQNKLTH